MFRRHELGMEKPQKPVDLKVLTCFIPCRFLVFQPMQFSSDPQNKCPVAAVLDRAEIRRILQKDLKIIHILKGRKTVQRIEIQREAEIACRFGREPGAVGLIRSAQAQLTAAAEQAFSALFKLHAPLQHDHQLRIKVHIPRRFLWAGGNFFIQGKTVRPGKVMLHFFINSSFFLFHNASQLVIFY